MAFSGLFNRSKTDKSHIDGCKGAHPKIRDRSLSPARSYTSEINVHTLIDSSASLKKIDKLLDKLSPEERALICVKHLDLGAIGLSETQPEIPQSSLTRTLTHITADEIFTPNETENRIQRHDTDEGQSFSLSDLELQSTCAPTVTTTIYTQARPISHQRTTGVQYTDAPLGKINRNNNLLGSNDISNEQQNNASGNTLHQGSPEVNTEVPKTPWIDFVNLDRAIKKAQVTQQEFYNMHKETLCTTQSNVTVRHNTDVTRAHVQQPYLNVVHDKCNNSGMLIDLNDGNEQPSQRPPLPPLQGHMTLSQALCLIPQFDGNPDNLNLFCVSVRQVLATFGNAWEPYILFGLASKLTGKAADGYRSRLTSYQTVEKLLADLTMQYSNVGIADDVLAQIKLVNQRPGESAGDFGLRVQKLHNRMLTIYDSALDLEISDRESRKRAASRDALQQFMFGLTHPLDHQVRSEHPRSLSEAIRLAVDFECKQSARRTAAQAAISTSDINQTSSANLQAQVAANTFAQNSGIDIANILRAISTAMQTKACSYCGASGHTEDACRRKRFETLKCAYCSRPGHVIAECFTLRNDQKYGRAGPNSRNDGWNRSNYNRRPPNNNWKQGRYNNGYNNTHQNGRINDTYRNIQNSNNEPNAQPLNSQDARYSPQVSSDLAQH